MLRPGEHRAEVCFADGETASVGYGVPFGSRALSLAPGHLVAVADMGEAAPLVLWRWYDAVVLEQSADQVQLWEPGHGEVLARSRDPRGRLSAGTRAYASAGLPGADWWVEGPVGGPAVAMDQVYDFYAEHDLWRLLV